MPHPTTFELPTTDQLTGLLSAVYFRHLLREEILPEARRSENPLSLFMVDIDDFMSVNDNYGHEAGDKVLTEVARTLKEVLPEQASLARYSGDEFAGTIPDTRLDDAFTLMEELRRRVAALRWDQWPELQITCSIGLSTYPQNGDNDVELLRQADEALFAAKEGGRNKVALPLLDDRMVTKTSHYTRGQLKRLQQLARTLKRNDASILREALDDVLKKYNDRLGGPPKE